jgi:predicted transcriptional regulator
MARKERPRVKPLRHPTDGSRALISARTAARLRLDQTAHALGVHPRTVTRWEVGETQPSPAEWAKLVALFAPLVPEAAAALASAADVPPARQPERSVDVGAIRSAIVRAADRLDLSPRRVRAALRDIVAATESANGTLTDLAQAAQVLDATLEYEAGTERR